jgi:PA14 domain
MAFLSLLRAAFAHWYSAGRNTRRARLTCLTLEDRDVPSVGGGFTAGGIQGEYFANTDLTGAPAFSRRDVRVDFDWQDRAPGGSTSTSFAAVEADSFSVRWTGQLVPKFGQIYTFHTISDEGVRLWIRPSGTPNWIPLVDHWNTHTTADDFAKITLKAGRTYDVKMEYFNSSGPATARLNWSSRSTPEEAIEPAMNLGVNAVTYDFQVYADAAKMGRAEWGDPFDYFGHPNVGTDATGWPTGDASHIFWEGQDPAKTAGTYQMQFTGRAEVGSWLGVSDFQVDGTDYGPTLPAGAGYDPATNITTAQVVLSGADIYGLIFRKTQRTADSVENTGITDVQFLRPIAPGSTTSYPAGELFDADVKDAFARFTTLRYLTANFNEERSWSERKLPGGLKAAWGDRHGVWENEVMLANETGKDLYITIPIDANAEYVLNLANLIKYGSDGVNPYTGPVANPVYPGLNPNLRVYVEWSNEVWNWAFSQCNIGANASRDAVLNHTPEGQIINYDGLRGWGDFRRWTALKTVQTSNTFRSIWGDAAMGNQVRVVLEYQYDNAWDTAVEALKFIKNYFGNGDGYKHVADPHPVKYYIWGAGGASYFGASNPLGLVNDITVPGGNFEGVKLAAGAVQANPLGTAWTFGGDAGVYRNVTGVEENSLMTVDGVGPVPTTPQGAQAMYVSGSGVASVTFDFPRAGVYALNFKAASKLGPDLGNPLDFYFDDQRVTPNAQDLTPNRIPWWPGNGQGRDPSVFTNYGTVPVVVTGPGRHTFQIVGRGTAGQTTVIDDVRVASTDAIFASRLPGGGQAAGQVSRITYRNALLAQAKYAKAYGLKVVAYEGGWSLGGDTQSVPIQSWAKYRDGRAAGVMAEAIDTFNQTGGELNVLGTYDQWYLDDAAHADSYPLVRGIDSATARLPAPPRADVLDPTIPLPPPSTGVQPGLPDQWTVNAVGAPELPGTAIYNGGQWVVQGAGENIGGSTDSFEFANTRADGDVTLIARVAGPTATYPWAKAGLMIRDGVDATAPFAAVFRTPEHGIQFETRSGDQLAPGSANVPVGDNPVWLKLVRTGSEFEGYYSLDGKKWIRIGRSAKVEMPSAVRVGLAITSHDPSQLATATFSSVSVLD